MVSALKQVALPPDYLIHIKFLLLKLFGVGLFLSHAIEYPEQELKWQTPQVKEDPFHALSPFSAPNTVFTMFMPEDGVTFPPGEGLLAVSLGLL